MMLKFEVRHHAFIWIFAIGACSGCELYVRRDFSIQVIERDTRAPAAGVPIKASYGNMAILPPQPSKANTDQRGFAQLNMPDTDSMFLTVGGDPPLDLPNRARTQGDWLDGYRQSQYLVWIKRGKNEVAPAPPQQSNRGRKEPPNLTR